MLAFSGEYSFDPHRAAAAVGETQLAIELTAVAQDAGLGISSIEIVALISDPAHWASAEIVVSLGSSQQTVTLATSALYGGQPGAVVQFAGAVEPGPLSITVPMAVNGRPDEWAEDIILIAGYSIELVTR